MNSEITGSFNVKIWNALLNDVTSMNGVNNFKGKLLRFSVARHIILRLTLSQGAEAGRVHASIRKHYTVSRVHGGRVHN